jgi:hypothetical protein
MRKYIIFISFIVIAAAIYLGWSFYSRKSANNELTKRTEEQAARDRAFVDAYGGDNLAIKDFYGVPGIIHRGEKAQLCYSVLNSERVRIEPPVENVWPSLSRCVDVMPKKDTTYKLIAEDAKGNTKTAELTIKVQ